MLSLSLPLLLPLFQGATVTPDVETIVTRVQATYEKAGDMQAKFEQTHVESLRGRKRSESGRFWAKDDGRVRWQYLTPVRKEFVYDGDKAYFYEPENAQVTIFDDFDKTDLSNALRFLIGQGDLKERFNVGPCTASCDLVKGNLLKVQLTPKKPMASATKVLMFVEPGTYRVMTSVVFDSLGNRTEYRFSEVKFGQNLKSQYFEISIPSGVQRLRAGEQGQKAEK